MKDVIAEKMEEYVADYYYPDTTMMQYIPDSSYSSYHDPTRIFDSNAISDDYHDIGNINYASTQYKVKPKNYLQAPDTFSLYQDDSTKSDFETAAAAMDVTLSSIGEVGLSFLATIVSLFSDKYDYQVQQNSSPEFDILQNYQTAENLQKGDFLRSLSMTPAPYVQPNQQYVQSTTLTPNYFSTAVAPPSSSAAASFVGTPKVRFSPSLEDALKMTAGQ